jgi:Tfp pilus assembly protein PilF
MKNVIVYSIIALLSIQLMAQNPDKAHDLVSQGVQLHDKGDYNAAIVKYDEALRADKDNLMAYSEKAYSLSALKKYEDCITCCKKAITAHPNDSGLNMIYVSYGSALDHLGEPDKAVAMYDEGLTLLPDFYLLHYNKGITLIGQDKSDEALLSFQKAVVCNPEHASSHNAIARVMHYKNKRIPALLAYCRFFTVEPTGPRAEDNLNRTKDILSLGVKKTGKNSISISIDGSSLGDTTADGKPNENSFSTVDLIMSMSAALAISENKKQTDAEKFAGNLNTAIASMEETKADNYGFYWDYYVPYFIEMKNRKYIETLSYLVFASSGEKYVTKWIKSHAREIQDFLAWSESYKWYSE